jgi:hypothetical protein
MNPLRDGDDGTVVTVGDCREQLSIARECLSKIVEKETLFYLLVFPF